jgi:tRNA U38,U39,U40 pseudouridine synthase TruA
MMRRISGGLTEVGRGYRSVEDFQKLIDPVQRETIQWPVVLPANGLTLHTITYGRWPQDNRERNSPDQDVES